MSNVIYSGVDLYVNERNKELIINPRGERFYWIDIDERGNVYENAILIRNEEGGYSIEGDQKLYGVHKDRGFNYNALLSRHPKELIRRHSFMGLVWYRVNGTLERTVKTRYACLHNEYCMVERIEVKSQSLKDLS